MDQTKSTYAQLGDQLTIELEETRKELFALTESSRADARSAAGNCRLRLLPKDGWDG